MKSENDLSEGQNFPIHGGENTGKDNPYCNAGEEIVNALETIEKKIEDSQKNEERITNKLGVIERKIGDLPNEESIVEGMGEIVQEIDKLSSTVSALTTDVRGITQNVFTLQAAVSQCATKAELQDEIKKVSWSKQSLDALKKNIGETKRGILTVKGEIDSIDDTIRKGRVFQWILIAILCVALIITMSFSIVTWRNNKKFLTMLGDGAVNNGTTEDATDNGTSVGGAVGVKTVEFGSYPQKEVTDSSLKSTLNRMSHLSSFTSLNDSIPSNCNKYEYYIEYEEDKSEEENKPNFMIYEDVKYGSEKYRGVRFLAYRPYYTLLSTDKDDVPDPKIHSWQPDNGYTLSTTYWFKFEPIRWQVLEKRNGLTLLLADYILDSQQYYHAATDATVNGKTVHPNNYQGSDIRQWLNEIFFKAAFSDAEKQLIQQTEVDNSLSSTAMRTNSNVCDNTWDKVFLLSAQEAMSRDYFTDSPARRRAPTAYSKVQGVRVYTDNRNRDVGAWWLRSPSGEEDCAYAVNASGFNHESTPVCLTRIGVVPALWANLPEEDTTDNETSEGGTSQIVENATISFDLNGAEGSIDPQIISGETALVFPEIPTRNDGYLFGGWYRNARCNGDPFDFSARVTQDEILYAKWVSYSADGVLPANGQITVSVLSKSATKKYYAFVPLVSGDVSIYSTGNLDTYGYLYDSTKTELATNDDGNGHGLNFMITYHVTAGTLYFIAPCGYSGSGTTTVCMRGAIPSAGGMMGGS